MAMLGAVDTGGTAADKAKAALASSGGAATPTATQYQIPIYRGDHATRTGAEQHATALGMGDGSTLVDKFSLNDEGLNAAWGAWYTFADEDRAALSKKMWYLGLIKDPHDFDGAYNVWKTAVTHAGRFAMTGKEIDPRDVLDMMGDAANGPGGQAKQKQGPVTRRQIDLTDSQTAKAWITQAFQQSMGRAPEDAEIRSFIDALGQREKWHPKIETTTPTAWDDQGNPIDSTTTTSGGFNSQAYLQNRISADPEANAHQAAGELYPALMQALGAGL